MKELERLANELIDNIISVSDEEILKESEEDYGDSEYEANIVRNIIKDAKAENKTKGKIRDFYQCPYDKACHCDMEDPCKGCEEWAKAIREGRLEVWDMGGEEP